MGGALDALDGDFDQTASIIGIGELDVEPIGLNGRPIGALASAAVVFVLRRASEIAENLSANDLLISKRHRFERQPLAREPNERRRNDHLMGFFNPDSLGVLHVLLDLVLLITEEIPVR